MIGALRSLLNLRSDREAIGSVAASWPEHEIRRRWNGWAAWPKADTTGAPVAAARTPWKLSAALIATRSPRRAAR